MVFVELSDSELEVMEILWKADKSLSFGELLDYSNSHKEKPWKKQTLNTFLYRMQKKGLLNVEYDGIGKKYEPAMTRSEYRMAETKAFLHKNYKGSIAEMLMAFNGSEKLGENEIKELRQLLEAWEKE